MCVACRPRKDDYISSLPPEADPFRPGGPSDGHGGRLGPCLDTLGVSSATSGDFAQSIRGVMASSGDSEALGDLPPKLAASAAALCAEAVDLLDGAMGGALAAAVGDPPAVGDRLATVSGRDGIWDRVRYAARCVMAMYLEAAKQEKNKEKSHKLKKWALKMSVCANHLCFEELDSGHLRLRAADFCRVRYCPVCAWRKSLALKARLYNNLSDMWEESLKNYDYISLTLTIKNPPLEELEATIKHMQKSVARLFDRAIVKKNVKGYIKGFEITQSDNLDPHPHIHLTLAVEKGYFSKSNKNYIDHDMWVKLWRESARLDYNPSVRVKKVKNRKKSGQTYDVEKEKDGLITALLETVKYQIKSCDLTRDSNFLAVVSLASEKKRFVSASGVFKGIFSNKKKIDNSGEKDDDGLEVSDDEMMMKTGQGEDGKAKYLQIYKWGMEELSTSQYGDKKVQVWAYRLARRQKNDIDGQYKKYRDCLKC